MADRIKIPTPTSDEDLGRGGDASAGTPAGSPDEREELGRDALIQPVPSGPRPLEIELPPSAKG